MKKTYNRSKAKEFGSEIVAKTVLWLNSVSDKTLKKIDDAIRTDEHVVAEKKQDAHTVDKVLCLEIKKWRVVVQITDKVADKLSPKEMAILMKGWSVNFDNAHNYAFRKLCAELNISTKPTGISSGDTRKSAYYAARRAQAGVISQAYLLNELISKMRGEYMLRAGGDDVARGILLDIIDETSRITVARYGKTKRRKRA